MMITITNKYWANNSIVEDENGYNRVIEFTIDGREGANYRAVIDPDPLYRIKQGFITMFYKWQEFRFGSWQPSLSLQSYETTAKANEYVQKATGLVVSKDVAFNSDIQYYNSVGEQVEESEAVTDGELNEGYTSKTVYTTIKDEYCSSLDHVMVYFDTTEYTNQKSTKAAMAEMFFQMHFVTQVLPYL